MSADLHRHSALTGTRRGLLPEDLMKFRWLQEIALSPNGDYIAYTVSQPDAAANGYQVHLYVYDTRQARTHRLEAGPGRVGAIAWSRDGMRLAYALQEGGSALIVIWSPDDTQHARYPFVGLSPGDLDWSPDGKRLAFVSWVPVLHTSEAPTPGIPAPTIRVIRRLRYKQEGAGWVQDRFRHVHTLELDTGDVVQLTSDECDYSQPRWSWSGSRLAFVALAREQNIPLGYGQIMLLDVQTGDMQPLIPGWQGAALSPQWRADDGAIAFAGHNFSPPVNRRCLYHAWLYDMETGQATDLSEEIDQTVGNYAVSDQRAGLTNMTVKWPGGSGRIYFLLTVQGASHLYRVTPGDSPQEVIGGKSVTFEYSPDSTGGVAFGMADPHSVGELFLLRDGQRQQITNLNPWLYSHHLSTPEEYWYDGLDGARVHSWLMKPPDFNPEKRYPVIVYVHCSMFSWDFYHEFQYLASAGYIVAYFNQRGTTAGYGQECALGNYYGKHEDEYAEIMLGVDDLITRPYVDADRMGVTGGSCGGFMTNWIIGHTNRFAAAVTQRSISDLVSKFGTSDNGPEQAEGDGAGRPWDNLETIWWSSPIAHAKNITTPLLIIHSSEDHRCALGQAEELFAVLRWLGREVEMVIFSGENHGLSRGGRPGNRIERLQRICGWFNRYLAAR